MENFLYAPWRRSYSESKEITKNENIAADDCVFCTFLQENDDEKNFILKRYKYCFVLMNKFPYNAGHVMILPLEHEAHINNLLPAVHQEMMELISACIKVIEGSLNAKNFNVGFNLGKIAGAGIPSHLHIHVLPRWQGDTNFLTSIGQTRVISFDLKEMYQLLKPYFQ